MPSKSLSRSSLLSFQKYSNLLAGNDPYIPPVLAYDLLATEILTGTQTSITFSSLNNYANDYKHLQIRGVARSSYSEQDVVSLRFNGDGAKNYALHFMFNSGSEVASTGATSIDANRAQGFYISGSNAAANTYGAGIVDILDPFSTTKNTTIRGLGGNPAQRLGLNSGLWLNTAAITSVELLLSGGSMVAGSRFSLYGLKGA